MKTRLCALILLPLLNACQTPVPVSVSCPPPAPLPLALQSPQIEPGLRTRYESLIQQLRDSLTKAIKQ